MSEKKKIRALGTISTNATQDPFLLCLHFLYFYKYIMHYAYAYSNASSFYISYDMHIFI